MLIFLIVALIMAMMVYIRVSPIDPDQWHQRIESDVDKTMNGGAIRIIPGAQVAFKDLNEALNSMDRTTIIAGSLEEGLVTYVTRSKWFGLPDYTTLERSQTGIKMFARLRFGRRDLGVNAARLRKLVAAIE